MEKSCPVCAAVYGQDAVFCDKDGSRLEDFDGGPRALIRRRALWLAVLFVAAMAVGVIALPGQFAGWVAHHLSYSSPIIGRENGQWVAEVNVANDSPFSGELKSLRGTILMNGEPSGIMADLRADSGAIAVPAHGTAQLPFALSFPSEIDLKMKDLMLSRSFTLRVAGDARAYGVARSFQGEMALNLSEVLSSLTPPPPPAKREPGEARREMRETPAAARVQTAPPVKKPKPVAQPAQTDEDNGVVTKIRKIK
jgi:hypothetical protein